MMIRFEAGAEGWRKTPMRKANALSGQSRSTCNWAAARKGYSVVQGSYQGRLTLTKEWRLYRAPVEGPVNRYGSEGPVSRDWTSVRRFRSLGYRRSPYSTEEASADEEPDIPRHAHLMHPRQSAQIVVRSLQDGTVMEYQIATVLHCHELRDLVVGRLWASPTTIDFVTAYADISTRPAPSGINWASSSMKQGQRWEDGT